MAINTTRNRLHRDGVIFRELEIGDETGFVVRVMDESVKPPKVTTVVQQPGQDTVTIDSLLFTEDRVYPNHPRYSRFAPPLPAEAESPDRVVELLQANRNPIAEVALQHLLRTPDFNK